MGNYTSDITRETQGIKGVLGKAQHMLLLQDRTRSEKLQSASASSVLIGYWKSSAFLNAMSLLDTVDITSRKALKVPIFMVLYSVP